MQRAVANHARTIRVPVHVVERQQKLSRAARRLEVELGREATKEELAEATGLPMQHVDEALGAAHASVSLNQTVGADDEGELGDPVRRPRGRRSVRGGRGVASPPGRPPGTRRAPGARAAHPRAALRLRGRAVDARGDRPRARPDARARPPARGPGAGAPRRAARPDPRRGLTSFLQLRPGPSGSGSPPFLLRQLVWILARPRGSPTKKEGNFEGEKVFASRPTRLDRDRAAPRHRGRSRQGKHHARLRHRGRSGRTRRPARLGRRVAPADRPDLRRSRQPSSRGRRNSFRRSRCRGRRRKTALPGRSRCARASSSRTARRSTRRPSAPTSTAGTTSRRRCRATR